MTLLNLHDDPEAAAEFAHCAIDEELDVASAQERRPQPRATGSAKPLGRVIAKQLHGIAKEAHRGQH